MVSERYAIDDCATRFAANQVQNCAAQDGHGLNSRCPPRHPTLDTRKCYDFTPKMLRPLLRPFAQKTSVKQCLLRRYGLHGGSVSPASNCPPFLIFSSFRVFRVFRGSSLCLHLCILCVSALNSSPFLHHFPPPRHSPLVTFILLQPQPKNVATFVATFRAKNLGKTVFVATLQPPEGSVYPLLILTLLILLLIVILINLHAPNFFAIRTSALIRAYPRLSAPFRVYPRYEGRARCPHRAEGIRAYWRLLAVIRAYWRFELHLDLTRPNSSYCDQFRSSARPHRAEAIRTYPDLSGVKNTIRDSLRSPDPPPVIAYGSLCFTCSKSN
jgi:hypothetical protein